MLNNVFLKPFVRPGEHHCPSNYLLGVDEVNRVLTLGLGQGVRMKINDKFRA